MITTFISQKIGYGKFFMFLVYPLDMYLAQKLLFKIVCFVTQPCYKSVNNCVASNDKLPRDRRRKIVKLSGPPASNVDLNTFFAKTYSQGIL